MFSVFLLGSTDYTLEIADVVVEIGGRVAGICHVGEAFRISYAADAVKNYRHADVEAWCARHDAAAVPFTTNGELAAHLSREPADFGLAAGWYHMVPASVRRCFARGCAGLHASLLPKLRGGAPLSWAILTGARETGVSLFELTDGVDDGALWGQERFAIGPRADAGDLVRASAEASRTLLRRCLPGIVDGTLAPRPQEGTPTWGLQRAPGDGAIDWSRPAVEIDRLVRAVARPYPGAFTRAGERTLRLWKTEPSALDVHGAPGQVWNAPGGRTGVVTGDGFLLVRAAETDDGADAMPLLATMNHQRLG